MLLKNDKHDAAALEEGGAHPRGGQERGRYRQSVRRLDDRLAGEERARRLPAGRPSWRRFEAAVARATQVTYSQDGTGAAGADVAIVVVGETPYAEMCGDRADLALSAEDLAASRM